MATLAELTARLEALREARASDVRSAAYGGNTVLYKSDGEMAAAIADLERQIANAAQPLPVLLRIHPTKGL